METLELKNEVTVGRKRFQIQTSYVESTRSLSSTIMHEAALIFKKEERFDHDEPEAIKERLGLIHREMITEMELLYYIADKVKSLKHPVSNNKLGLVFLKRNLIEEAIEQFKLAITREPNFLEAINNLGMAYLLENSYEEALKAFSKGINLQENYADLHNNIGYTKFELKKYPEAIQAFEQALQINPDYAEVHFNLGLTYLKVLQEQVELPDFADYEKVKEKSLEHIMFAAELMPPDNIKYFDRINEQLKNGKYEDALEVAEVIKNNLLKNRYAIEFENEFYLKFMFGGKGKDDRFITEYTQILLEAINRYPNFADLRNNLGIAYLIQCRNLFLKALDEFRQALKINPVFKKAEKNLKLAENDGKGFLILLRAILK